MTKSNAKPTTKRTPAKTKVLPIRTHDAKQRIRSKKKTAQPVPFLKCASRKIIQFFLRIKASIRAFMQRRPHRSFQRTYRRDYERSLNISGYVAFTVYVWRTLVRRKRVFIGLILLYALFSVLLGGVTGQDTYNQISELVKESSTEVFQGSWGKVGEAGVLLVSAFSGGSGRATGDQQLYLVVIFLLVWLTTVWLLREMLADRKPLLRDGLYNAASPFISTFLVALVGLLQLLPLGIVAVIYGGLSSIGLVSEGFGSMIFYVFAGFVALLSLYWLTSTFIAMVVVTLPGMYPMRALRTAGDLVVGRRMRIVYRLLWAMVTLLITWTIIVLPIIMLDDWAKGMWTWLDPVPIVPIVVAVMSAATTVWFSSYVYLFYRKIVDDDAKPA